MLDLGSERWKYLKSPYGESANEGIPNLLRELEVAEGKGFSDLLSELIQRITHQFSTYQITLATIPHLIKLFNEKVDKIDEAFQLIREIGYAIACEDKTVLDKADADIKRWYLDNTGKLENLMESFLLKHESDLDDEMKVDMALSYLAFRGFKKEAATLMLLQPGFEECELDCPECGEYVLLNLDEDEAEYDIVPENLEASENDNIGTWLFSTLHNMNEEYLYSKLPTIFGRITCPGCGQEYHVWDAMNYM